MLKDDLNALTQISELRRLQRRAAEAVAANASAIVLDRQHAVSNSRDESLRALEGWQALHEDSAWRPDIAGLWFTSIRACEAQVSRDEKELGFAARLSDKRRGEWRAAIMREDLAERSQKRAERAEAKRRDELALESALDLHNGKRGRA